MGSHTTILILTSEISGIINSFFRGRQNIFLILFTAKFVIKCAAKNVESRLTNKNFICENIFSIVKSMGGRSLFSRKIFKVRKLYPKYLKSTLNVIERLTWGQNFWIKPTILPQFIQSFWSWIIFLAHAKSLFKIVILANIFICYPISKIFAARFTTN